MNKQIIVRSPGIRLDKFLSESFPDNSRTYFQNGIKKGFISVNGHPVAKPGLILEKGDNIVIDIPDIHSELQAEPSPLKVVYEDNDLLVIDKPPGLTVHPSPGQTEHTLINFLLSSHPELREMRSEYRPGIVHRLDKDTSGLIIIAKNIETQNYLINQFKQRLVDKIYVALVNGRLTPAEGIIEAPVGRSAGDRKRMAITTSGKPARSGYKVLKYYKDYTMVEVKLETGRTHQIRVHFAAIGYPLVGDPVYGVASDLIARQFLHACCLSFRLPSGKMISLKSELPDDLDNVLRILDT
jgi:23S rRNA pseudouridine1911/1915/1917 synthase